MFSCVPYSARIGQKKGKQSGLGMNIDLFLPGRAMLLCGRVVAERFSGSSHEKLRGALVPRPTAILINNVRAPPTQPDE